MPDKYLELQSGQVKERITIDSSAGVGDAGKLIALNTSGQIDLSMMPTGIGPDTVSIVASESLSAGDIVNIYDNAGTPNVRKADANGRKADGFVKDAVSVSGTALVYFEGKNDQLSGLTIGSRYYLSETAGAVTTTPVTTSTALHQYVGTAVNASTLNFEPDDTITIA